MSSEIILTSCRYLMLWIRTCMFSPQMYCNTTHEMIGSQMTPFPCAGFWPQLLCLPSLLICVWLNNSQTNVSDKIWHSSPFIVQITAWKHNPWGNILSAVLHLSLPLFRKWPIMVEEVTVKAWYFSVSHQTVINWQQQKKEKEKGRRLTHNVTK